MTITFILHVLVQFRDGWAQTQGPHDYGKLVECTNLTASSKKIEALSEL